jgi:hypothetical protein
MLLHEAFRAFDSATRLAVLEATDEYCLRVFPVIHALRSHVPAEELTEHLLSAQSVGSYTLLKMVQDDCTGPEGDRFAILDDDLDPRNPGHVADVLALFQRGKLRRELPDELLRLDQGGWLEAPRAAARIALANVLHKPGFAKELYEEGAGFHPLSVVLVHVQLTKYEPDKLDLWDFIAALKYLNLESFSETGKSLRLNRIRENMNAHVIDPEIVYKDDDVTRIRNRFKTLTKELIDDFGPYALTET